MSPITVPKVRQTPIVKDCRKPDLVKEWQSGVVDRATNHGYPVSFFARVGCDAASDPSKTARVTAIAVNATQASAKRSPNRE